jgi:signal transduction histidine kinase/CheY-like chemotaxis protein
MNKLTRHDHLNRSKNQDLDVSGDELNLSREKLSHILKSARSATIANFLFPALCYFVFKNEVIGRDLVAWVCMMFVLVAVRTGIIYKLEHNAIRIEKPAHGLRVVTFVLGGISLGWACGWVFIAPQLSSLNLMIFVFCTTASMIAGMFAYSVYTPAFFAFNAPFMVFSIFTLVSSPYQFAGFFSVGLASLYLVAIKVAGSFSKIFEESVRLRFKDEILYEALVAERDQSISANLSKSKFIATASHDLRQPMHAVNVYLECLSLDRIPEPERQLVKKIKNSIATMNAMFESLLNISKLDSHITSVNYSEFEMDQLVAEIKNMYESRAQAKGLAFEIEYQNARLRADKIVLQQIIANLVSNAIQYTSHGLIKIDFKNKDGQLAFTVADTGCGITKEDQEGIFKEFYRADKTRALHDGLGLGLSIVKRLCDLIGAEVSVQSESGRGTTFQVFTRFKFVGEMEGAQKVNSLQIKNEDVKSLLDKIIVVVENDKVIADAYIQALSSKGAFVVGLPENENDLNEQIEGLNAIDFILCDYRLDETTGDLLIQKIRENYNQDIPALIVTAETAPSRMSVLANLHIPVLHKPVSFHEVILKIQELI